MDVATDEFFVLKFLIKAIGDAARHPPLLESSNRVLTWDGIRQISKDHDDVLDRLHRLEIKPSRTWTYIDGSPRKPLFLIS